jgi:hypothetical protein
LRMDNCDSSSNSITSFRAIRVCAFPKAPSSLVIRAAVKVRGYGDP